MTRTPTGLLASAAILAVAATAAHAEKLSESREIKKTIPTAGVRYLIVDNYMGDVTITGSTSSEIRLFALETRRARTQERLEHARQEVSLEVEKSGDALVICADGPFRDSDDCTEWNNHRNWRGPEYEVIYEMELEIPAGLDLRVRTIEGDIAVSSIRGDFEINGVNGRITMDGIDGSGHARTVNGPVKVSFDRNPSADCEFKTVNGEIDVAFHEGLSADMRFKTLNGDVLTDFEYRALPPEPVRTESRHGRTVFKMEPASMVRIASGGPRFEFENINGDILVRQH